MLSKKKPYLQIILTFFKVGVFTGVVIGLFEFPFRGVLTRTPLLGDTVDILAKPIMFMGFYACVFGVLALAAALMFGFAGFLYKKKCPSVLAFWFSFFTAAVMYVSVPINKALPPFYHPKSMAVNLILIIGAVSLSIILFLVTGGFLTRKLPEYGPEKSRKRLAGSMLIFITGLIICIAPVYQKGEKADLPETRVEGPNILFITVDTLRADHLPDYGYPYIKTPTITRLATEGVVFEQAYSTSSWTLPAGAGFTTGLTPRALHLHKMDDTLPSDVKTIAEVIREGGRATMAISSNPFLSKAYGFDRGFDRFLNVYDKNLRPALAGLFLFDNIFRLKRALDDAKHVTDLAFDNLDSLKGKSWFFWIHYMDPHKPYGGPWPLDIPDYDKGYDGSITFIYGWGKPVNEKREPLSEADLRHVLALYDADIKRFDLFLGKLLKRAKSMGLMKNTVVVLTSDHGEEFLEHGEFEHGTNLHKEQTHVPLIISGVGVPSKIRYPGLVSILDIPKTICRLAKTKAADTFMGDALLPFPGYPMDRTVLSETRTKGKNRVSIRFPMGETDFRRTFLHYDRQTGERKLYDLVDDPLEKINLAKYRPDDLDKAFNALTKAIKSENKAGSKINKGGKVNLDNDEVDVLKGLGYLVR